MTMAETSINIRISSVLGMTTGGRRMYTCRGTTVRDVLEDLFVAEPALRIHLFDDSGAVRQHVLIYVGEENMRWLGGLDAEVGDRKTLTILQAVSGG